MLYLLKRDKNVTWNENDAMIVRAKNKVQARIEASTHAEDEGSNAWLDNTQSSCEEILYKGIQECILCSYTGS